MFKLPQKRASPDQLKTGADPETVETNKTSAASKISSNLPRELKAQRKFSLVTPGGLKIIHESANNAVKSVILRLLAKPK